MPLGRARRRSCQNGRESLSIMLRRDAMNVHVLAASLIVEYIYI